MGGRRRRGHLFAVGAAVIDNAARRPQPSADGHVVVARQPPPGSRCRAQLDDAAAEALGSNV